MSAPEKIRVLVCDDQRAYAQGLARVLETDEYPIEVVGIATNGKQALAMCEELEPEVVLMDIQMPVMSGIEVTERIQEWEASPKVIMLTVSDDVQVLHAAMEAGAVGYALKDLGADEIVNAIRFAMGGVSVFPTHLAQLFITEVERKPDIQFTEQDVQLLRFLAHSKTAGQMGRILSVSERTMLRRLPLLYEKIGVRNKAEAEVWARRFRY